MAALIGMAMDRNTAISSRNDSRSPAPITSGSRCDEVAGGVDAGRRLPRRPATVTPVPLTTGGMTALRRWLHQRLGLGRLGRRGRVDDDDGARCRPG